jgi:UPF0755 protein
VTDLLDLGSERPPRPRRSRRKKSSGARWLAVLFVFLLVGGLAYGAYWAGGKVLAQFESAPDYPGPGSGEVVVQVMPGQTAADVATTLRDEDVVASRTAFLEVANPDPRAASIQPGFYRLLGQMKAADAFELLLDPTARILGRVTVPEGYTVPQTLEALAAGTEIPLADYEAASQDTGALGLPPYAEGRLEGFLFPATYEVEPGMTAVDVLSMMVARFNQAAETVDLEARAEGLGITPYEAVIVGSLIEREVKFDDEYPRVAQVVYNRLKINETIGIDAAVLFGLGRTSGGLTQSDLDKDTPYNLRRNRGLPPTPIASPGEATLQGAVNPSGGDELFYVLGTKEGRSVFTTNLQDHNRAVAKAKAEGIF